jgi:hypothetical protein
VLDADLYPAAIEGFDQSFPELERVGRHLIFIAFRGFNLLFYG